MIVLENGTLLRKRHSLALASIKERRQPFCVYGKKLIRSFRKKLVRQTSKFNIKKKTSTIIKKNLTSHNFRIGQALVSAFGLVKAHKTIGHSNIQYLNYSRNLTKPKALEKHLATLEKTKSNRIFCSQKRQRKANKSL